MIASEKLSVDTACSDTPIETKKKKSLPLVINIEEANFSESLVVIDELANFDVILGKDWFHDFNPNIDFDNHVVHLKNGSFQANGQSLPDPLPDSRTETASLRFILSGKRAVKDLRRLDAIFSSDGLN